ncbi:MAG TPA: hypothetical protein VL051_09490 [Burkholderiaceae bacterium]|nr:hypothetical protein [Burkholderiaceae bacterium]
MARGDGVSRSSAPDARLGRDYGRVVERLEILTGERGAAGKPHSAVRRGELSTLAASPQSRPVAAAPTQAEFNALQADVAAIYGALAKLLKA